MGHARRAGRGGVRLVSQECVCACIDPWERDGRTDFHREDSATRDRTWELMSVKKVVRADADWFGRLTPQQYYVTRKPRRIRPLPALIINCTRRGCFGASAVKMPCSVRRTSTIRARAGRPSPRRLRRRTCAPWMRRGRRSIRASRCCAENAMRIWGTFSTTVRRRRLLRYCINESSLRFVAGLSTLWA